MKCGILHGFSDCRCIRERGHEGKCWGKAVRGEGIITRAVWYSKNGKFKSHHTYETVYPRNAKRKEAGL